MKKLFKCILTILTGNPKHILYRYYCPYCNHGTDSYEDMHDHLTYYEWMCVPAVDKIMKELEEKNMACGEPAGCHYTKEEMDKKRKFAAKVMKGLAVVLLLIVVFYYGWVIV